MKRIFWAWLGLGFVALVYYLFLRPFEYDVKFRAKTLPGDLIETIRIWNRSLPEAEIIRVDSLDRLDQHITRGDRKYVYSWRFTAQGDSATKVTIQISEPARALANKILIPFTKQPIETDAYDVSMEFYKILKEHLKITNVKVVGEVRLKRKFCVCSTLETEQIEKAQGMMRDFPLLTSFVSTYNLKPDGFPIVRIKKWDHNQGKLAFDFCFPIVRSDHLPKVADLVYKEVGGEFALKAEYHGNYITSDRAWYELLHYARKNGYKVSGLPVEHFHDNPNLGIREQEWQADVYLPVEIKSDGDGRLNRAQN